MAVERERHRGTFRFGQDTCGRLDSWHKPACPCDPKEVTNVCDLNDSEELKKYTRRDFGALAASAGLLTALPPVANA
eukprot:gene1910-2507_t